MNIFWIVLFTVILMVDAIRFLMGGTFPWCEIVLIIMCTMCLIVEIVTETRRD